MAIITLGEGYHNYHHEFQHDYRNGVKAWQIDPTKWIIWILSKIGLAKQLRTVPPEKIILSQFAEAQRKLGKRLVNKALSAGAAVYIGATYQRLGVTARESAENRVRVLLSQTRRWLAYAGKFGAHLASCGDQSSLLSLSDLIPY
jgi:stearoyl-CoA desaturase (Delta-9 desaturase)